MRRRLVVSQGLSEEKNPMSGRSKARDTQRSEAGFALILALLSLMLLTFLGLTLAATTSTELQIAANYRWSQQALYNSEAGLEAGKAFLRDITPNWGTILPVTRTGVLWTPENGLTQLSPQLPPGMPTTVGLPAVDLRHWENLTCDARGAKVGYGLVLNANAPQGPLQFVTTAFGKTLNGAFTVWVRRGVLVDTLAGQIYDDPNDSVLVLTSEGIAPFTSALDDYAKANAAVVVRELTVLRGTEACETYAAQAGSGISGTGFGACALLKGCNMPDFDDAARDLGGTASERFGSGAAGTLCVTTVR